eukprot:762822-Hanusia_phi.AAC.19
MQDGPARPNSRSHAVAVHFVSFKLLVCSRAMSLHVFVRFVLQLVKNLSDQLLFLTKSLHLPCFCEQLLFVPHPPSVCPLNLLRLAQGLFHVVDVSQLVVETPQRVFARSIRTDRKLLSLLAVMPRASERQGNSRPLARSDAGASG